MSSKYKAVILDLGGVMCQSPMIFWAQELEPSLNLPAGSILDCLISPTFLPIFHQLECGQLTLEDFEPIFTYFYNQQNGIFNGRIPLFSSHQKWAKFNEEWAHFLPHLRSLGYKTALLTNNFFIDRAKRAETLPPKIGKNYFNILVESCKIGLRKPEKAIFQHVLAELKVSPGEAIFIDDLGQNLKAARELGIHTIKCSSDSSAKECIGKLAKFLGLGENWLQANCFAGNLPAGTRLPTKDEQLPMAPLEKYFRVEEGELRIRKFANGQSNPTYHIRLMGDGREFVLRKKPPGKLLPSAHRIEREFRVQKALKGHLPVPKMIDFVESVLPEPFYLMEFCHGQNWQDANLPEMQPKERRQLWMEAIRVMAKMHSIEPNKIGLADYGKSGKYFQRNLARMRAELKQQNQKGKDYRMAQNVLEWLETNCPIVEQNEDARIVHGDFRLDNLLFTPSMQVEAILDWELSTLGDPLADLTNFVLPFCLSPAFDPKMDGILKMVRSTPENGIPNMDELLATYLDFRSQFGHPEPRAPKLSAPNSRILHFGFVYALFRNAIILAGVFRRARSGQASNVEIARKLERVPEELLTKAWAIIGRIDGKWRVKNDYVPPFSPEMMRPWAFSLYKDVKEFIGQEIMPRERKMHEWVEAEETKWKISPIVEELRRKAKTKGLWNLFITEHLDPEGKFRADRLSTMEYGHICELMGKCAFAPEIFNCAAPDTGNMEVLIKYGNAKQQRKFLMPLLEGDGRSCFAMTEPDVASSDATNIQGCIVRDGAGHFLVNARKWFISGAAHPNCRVCLFMGRILPISSTSSIHQRQSILLIPKPSPGLEIVRKLSVLGNFDAPGGHCEILFDNVRVPIENLILGEGRGFEIAQGRLGPGRIHHCMRLIGYGERAMELMRERIRWRRIGKEGKTLDEKQSIRLIMAKSRMELEQARLLVLHAARLIDENGAKDTKLSEPFQQIALLPLPRLDMGQRIMEAAAAEIAMIKVVAPNAVQRILDRAIQTFGAAGLSSDWPLALFFVWARALRIADGPDIVHLETIAKRELAKL